MSATATEAPEVELTEFEEIEVQKVSGVPQGANGFTHLILKGLPVADEPVEDDEAAKAKNPGCGCCPDCTMDTTKAMINGKVDQKPDISLGEKIKDLLGQAMHNETQEVAAGHHGEVGDVHMLAQAHDIVTAWCNGEKTHPDGLKSAAADEGAEKAKLHAAVHRRYPDIGQDDSTKGAADIAEQETVVDNEAQGTEAGLTKADLEAAITKALEPAKAEIATLRDELAKVKATPRPGGPVMSANARPTGETQRTDELAAKAEAMRWKADHAISPADAAGYRQYARQLDEQVRAAVTD